MVSDSTRTLLVVDDEPVAREALARLLRFAGYDVATAAGGWEALCRLAADPKPRLIVLDLLMPALDGWSFCEALRAAPATADIPVIVCSGSPPDVQQSGSLGVQEFHPKPIDIDALLASVRRLCPA